ncbi:hypothetical protein [Chryseobacterium potabilaquae]|uniref:Uncharacterized protein n=1 Tax=Chryseobacterium potabilaquae TaxID=2675057 RepID=A0A6N4XFH4_9FLAO|nr:hypothetical protein [Chryseobacterium potabilaquae]CAA7197408.1 hypothetical protein CHRY9293_03467 [Chryseobacterium potabilaquae]
MKKTNLLPLVLFGALTYGQVGVNTTMPNATLDVVAKNATGTTTLVDGLLVPRVDRERAQSMLSVPSSTMIYVNNISTGSATGQAANIDEIGFYYFDGGVWLKLKSGSGSGTVYSGSTSIVLNGSSFQRAALTGDITAAANSNTTTIVNNAVITAKIANNAVTTVKVADLAITTAKIANNAVTPDKIATPVRTVTASTTLVVTDKGGFVYVNSSSATTITVPASLAAGFHVVIVQQGTGQVTIAGSGVTLTTARGLKTRARYSAVGIIKQTAGAATVTGDGSN